MSTNQATAEPAIDQQRPADAIAFALWTYNREWANAHDDKLPEGVTVATGDDLYAELARHTEAGVEPRRWSQHGPAALACLGASIYAADTTVIASPRGYRIVHGEHTTPEVQA